MRQSKICFFGVIFFWLIVNTTCFGENNWFIRINIPEFKLFLYRSNVVYATYNVAVGKEESPSPVGDYWIVNKVVNPTWYPSDGKPPVPPGPDNPLGTYWMGLNVEGIGIHGNSADWSIGKSVSLGCFRLHNKDIQRLFELIPVGTQVQIVYETIHAGVAENHQAWLEVFPDIYHLTNQESEIQKVFSNLGWPYEPHWKALRKLLQGKKPLKIEVPRVIRAEGESLAIDGFYWEDEVYLAKSSLKALEVSIKPTIEPALFKEYLKLDTVNKEEGWQYFWDQATNTLRIRRLKILVNGTELTNGIHQHEDGQFFVDLKLIAAELGVEFCWDYVSRTAICKDVIIPGEVSDGIFWVEPRELNRIWPGINSHWEEITGVLELVFQ